MSRAAHLTHINRFTITAPMRAQYFIQLVALSALWGASFLFIRIASPVFGPNVLAFLRVTLATLTLALLMRALGQRWAWRQWPTLALIGALSVAMPFLLFAWAGLQLPAGYSALLNSTAVIFGMFASARMGEDTITPQKLIGCLCGFAGVALIVSLGPVEPSLNVVLAVLACIAASACYGFSAPITKQAVGRLQPLQIAAGIHAMSLLMVLPGAVYSVPSAHFTWGALAAVAAMGIVTSGLAYWAHLRILRHVTPVAAMSPIFMVPVFGVLWGHLFLGEELGHGLLVGGSLVLLASALITGFNPLQRG